MISEFLFLLSMRLDNSLFPRLMLLKHDCDEKQWEFICKIHFVVLHNKSINHRNEMSRWCWKIIFIGWCLLWWRVSVEMIGFLFKIDVSSFSLSGGSVGGDGVQLSSFMLLFLLRFYLQSFCFRFSCFVLFLFFKRIVKCVARDAAVGWRRLWLVLRGWLTNDDCIKIKDVDDSALVKMLVKL